MLNPTQLKLHNFQLLENGCYSPREVDNFFRQVTEDYSSMFSENGELVRKLGILAAKLEEYRKDESVLRDVLMNAQKNAELLIASAQQRANEMIEEANAQVQRIMKDGETIIDSANDKAHKISIAAEAEYESLIASAKVLSESYIATATEKCAEIRQQTQIAVEQMLNDVEAQSVAVLEQAETDAQAIKDEAASTIEEYISDLRENARVDIEEKADAARKLFEESQAEAERITTEAATEADALLASVKEQTESLLSAALAQKEAIEISSSTEAQELIEESRKQAEMLLEDSRREAEAMLENSRAESENLVSEAHRLAEEASVQHDLHLQEAAEKAQSLLDDGRNKAIAMLTEAQTVSQDAKQRSENNSQQILVRIKEQALKMLTDAKSYSDEVCEKVLTQAEQVITSAKLEADRILSEAKDYAEKTKKEITDLSDARMSQAMDMSGSLISSAQADAQKIIATAQTRVSVAFDDVEGRVEQTLQEAERKRVEMLEVAKAEAEETTKTADENAQRMMDEAIEKAADMLLGAKQENERIIALTADMKQQLADSIAFAQAEYDALREKAMELRKKMLAQLLTEEEQVSETANRSIRDIPEFDAQAMLREGMKRAKETAAEIVTDSKEVLSASGIYAERTEYPKTVADVKAQSVPAMVEEIQRRIDIDDQFDGLVSEPIELQELPSLDVTSEIDDRIISNAAMDVSAIVDGLIGEDGFVTVNDSIADPASSDDENAFADLPDFDSMISAYMAVKLDSDLSVTANENLAPTQNEKSVDSVNEFGSSDSAIDYTKQADEQPVQLATDEDEEFFDEDSFESLEESDSVDYIDNAEAADEEVSEEPIGAYEGNDTNNIIPEENKETAEDDEWEDFGDFEDIGDAGFEDFSKAEPKNAEVVNESIPSIEVGSSDEFVAPIHEDYIQEDAVFTDYDDSLRMFEDVSDIPVTPENETEEAFDSGFEIDFSVFEDVPKREDTVIPTEADVKSTKGGFFRRNKKK